MAIVPLIDVITADENLPVSVFPEWGALDDPTKEYHILNASTYVIKTWSCTDEDFETPDLSPDAERAVSLYAEADRAGNLYGSVSDTTVTGQGNLTRLTNKVGSLEQTQEWSDETSGGDSPVGGPLDMADDIFCAIGCTTIRQNGVVNLVRN